MAARALSRHSGRASAALLIVLAACSSTPRARDASVAETWECRPLPTPELAWSETLLDDEAHGKVVFVSLEGAERVPEAQYTAMLQSHADTPLDPIVVRADLRRLMSLEVLSDARADVRTVDGGVVLTIVVVERAPLHSLSIRGLERSEAPPPVVPSRGEPYDASQLARQASAIAEALRRHGHLDASARSGGRRRADGSVDVCIDVHPGPRFVLGEIVFEGNETLSDDALRHALLEPDDGDAFHAGKAPRPELLRERRYRLETPYLDRGLLSVRVTGPELVRHPSEGTVDIAFQVHEGPVYRLGDVKLTGLPPEPTQRCLRAFRMSRGDVAKRLDLLEAVDRVRACAKAKNVNVESNMDSEARRLDLELQAVMP